MPEICQGRIPHPWEKDLTSTGELASLMCPQYLRILSSRLNQSAQRPRIEDVDRDSYRLSTLSCCFAAPDVQSVASWPRRDTAHPGRLPAETGSGEVGHLAVAWDDRSSSSSAVL